ncbi:MAG: type II secretion system F family protein [Planctomycetaceae bacterium]|nr:type II secretion system F family protein [Planctomycetaceae bacterium]
MELALLGSILIGIALAVGLYAGQTLLARGFAFIESDFRDKLRRLRRPTKNLRTLLVCWAGAVLGVSLVMWVGLGLPVLGVLTAIVLFCLPWYFLRRLAEQRREQIEDQLADAMVSLSSAVRAGLSLAQAMEILARQCPMPICQEFQQLYGEYQMGKTLETCLKEAKTRLSSENFALFAAAVEASRQSGGRLNETIERIAYSVRELQRLERKVQSETASARKSAVYMALAPIFILAMYYFAVDAEATSQLFIQVPGQLILAAAAILNVIAYLWARHILSPDI